MAPVSDRTPRVLLIEDDLPSRQMYADALTGAGFDPVQAHNGLQAVEKAAELLPDAVVTDLAIPGIDGFELCRRLRSDPRTSRIPILGMTGWFMSDADLDRARRSGCHAVLIKPFPPETLIEGLLELLRNGSAL
jgi:twitching motility two-component system response regulator PilH